jgi:hypothetical protein
MSFESPAPLLKYPDDLGFHFVYFVDGVKLELIDVRKDELGVVF